MKNDSLLTETTLWGRKADDEEWCESLLSTNPEIFANVITMAKKDGFVHFRIAKIDLSKPPNFTSILAKKIGGKVTS